MHARRAPHDNVFRYPVYMTLLDLDELPQLDRTLRLFGWNRRAVTSFHDADHIDVRALLAGARGRARRARLDPGADEPARARPRLQPGLVLVVSAGRRDARLHRRRGQQHLRRAATRTSSCRRRRRRGSRARRLRDRQAAARLAVHADGPGVHVVVLGARATGSACAWTSTRTGAPTSTRRSRPGASR